MGEFENFAEKGKFIIVLEIERICNMHPWLRGN